MDVARMDRMDMPGSRKGRRRAKGNDCGGVGMGTDGLLWLCCEIRLIR